MQKTIVQAGANPNLASDTRYTPLIAAASVGAEPIVSDLIAADANINAVQARSNSTALHIAALRGHSGVVQRLLESGADPFIRTSDGSTPRDLARGRGHYEIEALLLKAEQRWVAPNEHAL